MPKYFLCLLQYSNIDELQNIVRQVLQLHHVEYIFLSFQTMSYDPNLQHTSLLSNPSLYQPMTVTTTSLHHFTPSNPLMPLPSSTFTSAPAETNDVDTISEATYPAEGFDYFLEIQNYLLSQQYPPNVSNNYKLCLKKRALHYLVSNLIFSTAQVYFQFYFCSNTKLFKRLSLATNKMYNLKFNVKIKNLKFYLKIKMCFKEHPYPCTVGKLK